MDPWGKLSPQPIAVAPNALGTVPGYVHIRIHICIQMHTGMREYMRILTVCNYTFWIQSQSS